MAGLTAPALASLVQAVPFPKEMPLAVAFQGPGSIVELVQGYWADSRAVTATDRFYAASLAKQVTAAAIAVLINDGRLEPTSKLGQFMRELPAWLQDVTLLQILGHIGSLPVAGELEAALSGEHWTTDTAIAALRTAPNPTHPPGSRFVYSNVGYIALARIVELASGLDFASFVRQRLFDPLALSRMEFLRSDESLWFAQMAGMGPSLPLSQGDGGLWTTAGDFARWLAAQNSDVLGIANLVERPAQLSDGTMTDYGWGIGLRTYRGAPLFIHGGSWRGASCKAVRSRGFDISVAVLVASETEQDNVSTLVEAILAACT